MPVGSASAKWSNISNSGTSCVSMVTKMANGSNTWTSNMNISRCRRTLKTRPTSPRRGTVVFREDFVGFGHHQLHCEGNEKLTL
ncbi:unnamed protein product [Nesidiocoris tenuis]|uniref:Uncharacterized protein n=1 Tax=Nesidiocoris tenuis TaxID=355587 RepID=A0A6H5GZ70_9HEMI|nr:unnamed protein product [Nesidiocoris tenuis]CAB0008302.1 unnamed protein product [Nesidiocoris tenuis]